MPRTSKGLKTKNTDSPEETIELETTTNYIAKEYSSKKQMTKWYVLIAVILLIVGLGYKNKNLFLAGMVGKTPIFKWQLDQALEKKYGKQEFDAMVIDALVQKEAASKKISITQKELTDKEDSIKKQLPANTTLEDFLKTQGMTKEDFNTAIKNQLLVEKLLSNDIKVTDAEIEDFITKNKESFSSSDSAAIKQQATDYLQQQKLSQKFQDWLTEVKKQITVQSYL
jgi:hypothetical protein